MYVAGSKALFFLLEMCCNLNKFPSSHKSEGHTLMHVSDFAVNLGCNLCLFTRTIHKKRLLRARKCERVRGNSLNNF